MYDYIPTFYYCRECLVAFINKIKKSNKFVLSQPLKTLLYCGASCPNGNEPWHYGNSSCSDCITIYECQCIHIEGQIKYTSLRLNARYDASRTAKIKRKTRRLLLKYSIDEIMERKVAYSLNYYNHTESDRMKYDYLMEIIVSLKLLGLVPYIILEIVEDEAVVEFNTNEVQTKGYSLFELYHMIL